MYAKGWRNLSEQYKVQQAVDQLVELGWLMERGVETGGRKTVAYDVNPRIFAQ